jgi:hypothetical protein
VGTKLKVWKMNPTAPARSLVSLWGLIIGLGLVSLSGWDYR